MQSDDQAFLDQIEQNIRSKDNEQVDARKEAEQRAREMERVRQASPQVPGGKASGSAESSKPNPLEDDPRYKEYFQRLKRQKGIAAPAAKSTPVTEGSSKTHGEKRAGTQSISPGAIVRFDDGSIGVYKDAVSGRDYALFYFLHPDGQFNPEGVFLQCYQATVIGTLPENYFSELRDSSSWKRDLIVYHLNSFEHVDFLNTLAEHEERKPKPGSPAKKGSVVTGGSSTPPAGQQSEHAPAQAQQPQSDNVPVQEPPTVPEQGNEQDETEPESGVTASAEEEQGLVKGRKFQIKFGGKQWEAVYWSNDPEGAIVAHSTHGNWSLMRLDLQRFKDSLVLADMVDAETLEAIAKDASKT